MKAQLLLRMQDDMKERLRAIAKQRSQTMNQLVITVLWQWLKDEEGK